MAGEVEVLKLLCSSLQSHKVKVTKMANFLSFSWPGRSTQLSKVVIPVYQYSGLALASLLFLWPLHGPR